MACRSLGKTIVVSIVNILFLQAEAYSAWTPDTFPNPNTDPASCGRQHVSKSWICDPDGIISRKNGDVVEGILKDIADANEPYAVAKDCGSGTRFSEGYQARHHTLLSFPSGRGVTGFLHSQLQALSHVILSEVCYALHSSQAGF
jgi:hypothetical protein